VVVLIFILALEYVYSFMKLIKDLTTIRQLLACGVE